jgi:hypothetical protein
MYQSRCFAGAVIARVAEPFVLIRRMVQYQVCNDSYVSAIRLVDEPTQVSQGADFADRRRGSR